jgi:LL-diaminopimelate aminotransferase
MPSPADRMQILTPHFFAQLSARIAELQATGADVIRLDEGSPDLPPAAFITQALTEAANRSDTHCYQPHRGTQELRAAWASMYSRLYNVDLDPTGEIIPLIGSKEGIFHLLQAYIGPGDLALVPDPGYITYTRGALFSGGEVQYFPLQVEQDYLPDLSAIPPDVARRAKIMFLNYPNNPTAAVATLDCFAAAVDFARQYDLLLCHDAAYAQVTFDGYQAPSLMQIPGARQVAIEFNTLSKSHNMAGWRVGAAVGQTEALKTLFNLKTNSDSSHFYPILHAATVAMTGDQAWLAERNEIYRQRRDVMVGALRRMGLPAKIPLGSLYVWSPVPAGFASDEFVTAALEHARVSLTPGTLFGQNGQGYIRIAFTAPVERIEEAMHRLSVFVENL